MPGFAAALAAHAYTHLGALEGRLFVPPSLKLRRVLFDLSDAAGALLPAAAAAWMRGCVGALARCNPPREGAPPVCWWGTCKAVRFIKGSIVLRSQRMHVYVEMRA